MSTIVRGPLGLDCASNLRPLLEQYFRRYSPRNLRRCDSEFQDPCLTYPDDRMRIIHKAGSELLSPLIDSRGLARV